MFHVQYMKMFNQNSSVRGVDLKSKIFEDHFI